MAGIDFAVINDAARRNISVILKRWFPGGRAEGHEYIARNPKRAGLPVKIDTRTGRWVDSATGECGDDVISLAAYLFNLEQDGALQLVAAIVGMEATSSPPPPIFDPQSPRPDAQAIDYFLWALFHFETEGLIEIAWADPENGSLRHAQLFRAGELDAAVRLVVEMNSRPNCNVYVGAAVRKPETARDRRSCDGDFLRAWAVHADWDEPGSFEQAFQQLAAVHLAPRLVVVTGRHPHTRAQGWWLLDKPISDAGLYSRLLKNLAGRYGGDTTVTNPSRVMRVAGSIAWPLKNGRILERTTLVDHCGGFPPELEEDVSGGDLCL